MWFLEIIESALLAVPWIAAAIVGAIALVVIFAIASWVMMYVWVDVLDHDVSWNLEPAGSWDPDDASEREGEVADGRPT